MEILEISFKLLELLFKQLEIWFKLKLGGKSGETIKIPNSVDILEVEQGKDPRLGSRLTLSVSQSGHSTTIFAA